MKGFIKSVIIRIHRTQCLFALKLMMKQQGGFGMNELLGIAAALILAAFIIIPGLRTFTDTVMDRLTSWWNASVVSSIFPAS